MLTHQDEYGDENLDNFMEQNRDLRRFNQEIILRNHHGTVVDGEASKLTLKDIENLPSSTMNELARFTLKHPRADKKEMMMFTKAQMTAEAIIKDHPEIFKDPKHKNLSNQRTNALLTAVLNRFKSNEDFKTAVEIDLSKVQFSRDEFEVEEQEVEDDRSLPAGVVQKGVVNSNVRLTMNTLNNSQEISQKVDSLIKTFTK